MLAQALLEMGELQSCDTDVYRIVETQETAATTSLVDNLEEQDLLEQLIDEVKPAYRTGTQSRHYLISSPFRYPPLKYGSRFGDITMPSYFYASDHVDTALVQCAYYRFVFFYHMIVPYEKAVKSDHMTFSVHVRSKAVADLTAIVSTSIKAQLTSPTHYTFTQQLGRFLSQEKGAEMIQFCSARHAGGVNYAIANEQVITSEKPENNVNWICHSTLSTISFVTKGQRPVFFEIERFLVEGDLPAFA
jgi:hypothetical protein